MEKNSLLNVVQTPRQKFFTIILFWGAIWGIIEASLGLVLHTVRVIPTGTILFPIGYYFMQKSYRASGEVKSIFYTSALAASIKLVNLFSPSIPAIRVLNPSASILLEGLGVALVFKYFIKKDNDFKIIHALTMSMAWRLGYYIMCFTIFVPLQMMDSTSITNMGHFTQFFLINSTINTFIIYGYEKIRLGLNQESRIRYTTSYAVVLYLAALVVQWIL